MRHGNAVQYDRYGGFDVVQLVPQERPDAGPGEIVVEVVAAGLNHIERFLREGKLREFIDLDFPAHQGVDFAGIVRARGEGVKDLRVGDEVLGHAPTGGAHANWVRVPRGAVIKKPELVGWEVAGGLYLAGCTAATIVRGLRLGPQDTVVISAAAGGVGHIQCQLAHDAGATVIALGSARNHDYLRQIGTLPVVYGEGEEQRIREIADGREITAFIDNHGESDAEHLSERLGIPADRFVSSEERRDVELRFLRAPAEDDEARELLTMLTKAVQDRRVQVLISGFYPFEYIVDAYEDLAQMQSRGKVVIGMQTVETGARMDWYRSEKNRDLRDPVRRPQTADAG
ncbi:NADPH:quinone reductase-like Zn-dependent oxidoreductase [Curtobacterium luteum]|uniref:NADPH:quinone reductase n=2 Tax=Curtobacterium TaxID=2034 RepID=A0A8H9G7D2_9MICO|nr:NADP-dependent oxidoreductase [Curtobacterium luteum]MBM7802374.1 NADPH:quinone reductase-like Zn-dependent oxidoreductase [Curtobacterium luteum]NUU50560.1 NADP-dependent oxidoreductase [Curtobacterium luteum]GGK92310.1 NADPH:quinone reductase [Curtobacterium luteum]